MSIDKIFILHYTKLTERKEKMLELIERERLSNIEWVEKFDREILTRELIMDNFVFNPRIMNRVITIGEIANGMGHNYILEKISESCGNFLVIEDDMLLSVNFIKNVHVCMERTPSDWEVISIGGYRDEGTTNLNGYLYRIEEEKIQVYKPERTGIQTGAFIIKDSLAKRIVKHPLFRPFSAPIDETLCYILGDLGARVYWANPLLAYEGSKTVYGTSFKDRGF